MPKKSPPEFKRDVVRVARRGDLSQAEVAADSDTSVESVRRGSVRPTSTTAWWTGSEQSELVQLRRELRRLERLARRSPVTGVIGRSRRWTTSRGVCGRREPVGMSPLRRSPVPIASAAELSLWWAEVLSERDAAERTLSFLWPDSSGHRLERVLTLAGARLSDPSEPCSISSADPAARWLPRVPRTPALTPPLRCRVRTRHRSTMTTSRGPELCR